MRKYVNICLMVIFIVMLIFSSFCIVQGTINPNDYKNIANGNPSDYSKLYEIGGRILGVIQVIGAATSIIMFIFVGIKYMTTSVAEKATIKESLKGFVIGAFVLFGATSLITFIRLVVSGF